MTDYAAPGMNVKERDRNPHPITGVSTSTAAFIRLACSQRTRAGGPPYLLLRRLAPCFFSAQQWFFRRGGDPSSTQRRDPADELYRNRFGEWEMDRPLS